LDPTRNGFSTSIDLCDGVVTALDRPSSSHAHGGRSLPAGGIHLNARGTCVIPGLIDCHQHTIMGGLSLLQLDLSAARSRSEFEALVSAEAARLDEGVWLEARGWSEHNWPDQALPDQSWLTRCGDRPVVCWRSDHHACLVNGAVLAQLGREGALERDPPGGRIVRDRRGQPTGLLQEAAAWSLIRSRLPAPSLGRRRDALRRAQQHLCSLGLTTVMSMEYAADLSEVLLPSRGTLAPRMRVTLLDRSWPLQESEAWRLAARFHGDDRLALVGFKAFIDGTLGSRTARMLEPFEDSPGNRGVLVELAEQGVLGEWARLVGAAGFSPSMHAIGDEALRLALEAIESMPEAEALLARVEHAQTVHRDDLRRTAGRRLSMQPLHRADDGRFAMQRLGQHRMDRFFPFRSLLDAGALLGFGSDWPIVSADPIRGMHAAISGLTLDGQAIPEVQRLTPAEALAGYTRDAARLLGADQIDRAIGTLAPGAAADLVVLDRDPLSSDWSGSLPRVLATVVGGEVVHGWETLDGWSRE